MHMTVQKEKYKFCSLGLYKGTAVTTQNIINFYNKVFGDSISR